MAAEPQPAQEAAAAHMDMDGQQPCPSDPQPPSPTHPLSTPLLHLLSTNILPRVSSLASIRAFLRTCKAAHSLSSSVQLQAQWLALHRPASALHLAAGLQGGGSEELLLELLSRPGLLEASDTQVESRTPLLYLASRAGHSMRAVDTLIHLGKGALACGFHDLQDQAAAFNAAKRQRQATVFDLHGLELKGELNRDLQVPALCTLRSGSIYLPKNILVCFEGSAVLDSLMIKGAGRQYSGGVVVVSSSGQRIYQPPQDPLPSHLTVHMRGCSVDGARAVWPVAAVCVTGPGSKLVASGSTMCSSIDEGLYVGAGAHLVLSSGCKFDGNARGGLLVAQSGSSLFARDSSMSGNGENNARVCSGARAHIERCDLNRSVKGSGLCAEDEGTSVFAWGTSICDNYQDIVCATAGSSVRLSVCRCDRSRRHYGYFTWTGGTITTDAACTAIANARGSAAKYEGLAFVLWETWSRWELLSGVLVNVFVLYVLFSIFKWALNARN